jgi:Protein of unknown function (DUF3710)
VGIFRHGTKDTTPADITPADISAALPDPTGAPGSNDAADAADLSGSGQTNSAAAGVEKQGPFDRSEVDGLDGRLDLGSLWVTGVPGMELRLEVEQESQKVVGVTAVLGESAVQLQAFAAPRSDGIWLDIRQEIAASITGQGGTADLTSGPFGAELQARMPGQGPDGRTVFSPARFIGVDGPRWFLRAVLSGRAAIDEDAASVLLDVVRATVVVRGDEAMAPRELLALNLPDQPEPVVEHGADEGLGGPNLSDLKPFERGPEITEIH